MAQATIGNATVNQDKNETAQSGTGTLAETPIKAPVVLERPPTKVNFRAAQFLFVSSVAADLGTTWTLPPGWTEGNPLLGKSKGQQVAVSVGLGLLTIWEARRLDRQGHTTAAKFCLWLGTALHSAAAAHNASIR
jgi:hypothetical protein